jgi:hypothetical protein
MSEERDDEAVVKSFRVFGAWDVYYINLNRYPLCPPFIISVRIWLTFYEK